MCVPIVCSLQFNSSNYGLTFIHFLCDILISLYPKLLFTPLLLLLSAPPSHWRPFYLTLSPALLNYIRSSFLRSFRHSFECHFFSIYYLCQPFCQNTRSHLFYWILSRGCAPCSFCLKSYPSGQLRGAIFVGYQLKGEYYFSEYYWSIDCVIDNENEYKACVTKRKSVTTPQNHTSFSSDIANLPLLK